jgi:hypothetical protein
MKIISSNKSKICIFTLIMVLVLMGSTKNVLAQNAQTSQSSLYVPVIDILSVPDPLALPNGAGEVTYNYTVKDLISGAALTDIEVVDNKCSPVNYVSGDINGDSKLDYSETWKYACATKLSRTTENMATALGTVDNFRASHETYTTVRVGLNDPSALSATAVGAADAQPITGFPDQGITNFPSTGIGLNSKIMIWGILSIILVALVVFFVLIRRAKNNGAKNNENEKQI